MINFVIASDKWIPIKGFNLEQNEPYWCKQEGGTIVMAAPFNNGASSGMAKCLLDEKNQLVIIPSEFYIKIIEVQPVIYK